MATFPRAGSRGSLSDHEVLTGDSVGSTAHPDGFRRTAPPRRRSCGHDLQLGSRVGAQREHHYLSLSGRSGGSRFHTAAILGTGFLFAPGTVYRGKPAQFRRSQLACSRRLSVWTEEAPARAARLSALRHDSARSRGTPRPCDEARSEKGTRLEF